MDPSGEQRLTERDEKGCNAIPRLGKLTLSVDHAVRWRGNCTDFKDNVLEKNGFTIHFEGCNCRAYSGTYLCKNNGETDIEVTTNASKEDFYLNSAHEGLW